jgi:hypothetical protein
MGLVLFFFFLQIKILLGTAILLVCDIQLAARASVYKVVFA